MKHFIFHEIRIAAIAAVAGAAGIVGASSTFAAPPSSSSKPSTVSPKLVPEAERAQIAAATANAFYTLRRDVEGRQISPDLTVDEFLRRTEGREALTKALHRAEQIGGPRWIDDQTCQIQLEIAGARIVQALSDIAAAESSRSPMPANEIERRLRTWNDRTFAATGSSIRADMVQNVRPAGVEAWRGVDDATRVAAIQAARDNAVYRVVEELSNIQVDSENTFGQLLEKNPPIKQKLSDWLRQRPVTSLQFQDDLQVRYTLALSRSQLFNQFVEAATAAGVKLPPEDELEKL